MEFGFYRQGLWARDLVEVSSDPAVLHDGNFWAVVLTYEGECTFARFADVRREAEHEFFEAASRIVWNPPQSQWRSSLDENEYQEAVARVRSAIARGDVYQINLCRILEAPTTESNLAALIPRLNARNPAPYLTSIELPGLSIASASPELLLRRDSRTITSSPIKGTARERTGFLEKDHAENIMIVDLVRHDFGAICSTGSIHIPRLLQVEEHPGLYHLVSDVQGELRAEVKWREIFDAVLPAGSISGAPKSSALDLISRLEPTRRGPYCGALGWVQGDQAELAVGIRTFWLDSGSIKFGTGAGITWGSDPKLEWAETELKAARLLSIINSD